MRGTPIKGIVVACDKAFVTIRDDHGRDHKARLRDGAFDVGGKQGHPRPPDADARLRFVGRPSRTASGSVAVPGAPARIARASRILVEGLHDAELVEKVWGDDLRIEGVVVEMLDGADNLVEVVRGFGPRPGRRLGILLDHLVDRLEGESHWRPRSTTPTCSSPVTPTSTSGPR